MNVAYLKDLVHKPQVVKTAVYGIGLATGFVAGRAWTAKKLGEEFDNRLNEEMKRNAEFYKRLYKRDEYSDPATLVTTGGTIEDVEVEVDVVVEETPLVGAKDDPAPVQTRVDYTKVAENYKGEADDLARAEAVVRNVFKDAQVIERDGVVVDETPDDDDDEDKTIVEVDEDEFLETDYVHERWTFHLEDGVLANAEGGFVNQPHEVIGNDALHKLDNMPDGVTELHILDHGKRVGYLIRTVDSSFGESFMQHSWTRGSSSRRFRPGDDE